MAPTSTDAHSREPAGRPGRRRTARVGVPVLAVLVGVPIGAAAVIGRGGSPGERPAALAASIMEERPDPDRASRSGVRAEAPPAAPEPVTVIHDGRTREVAPAAATVRELLAGLGVVLDADDEVTPPLDARPGRTVTVVRVAVTRVTEDRAIPIPKELHDDPGMPRGETRVTDDGSPGAERVVFEITRRDGRVVAKRRISSEVTTPARPRVVFVGRGGGRGAPTDSGAEVPLKLRIAQEAFDEGEAGRRAGHGQQEGGASWYRYKPGTCAHRTLPKGTVVTVTNVATGQAASCTVADRGPFVAGRIIDLDHSVFRSIADPKQGVIRVRIEW